MFDKAFFFTLRLRSELPKSASMRRKGFPFTNALFYACDRGFSGVKLRTAYFYFVAFKIIFSSVSLNSREFAIIVFLKFWKIGAVLFFFLRKNLGIWESRV